MSVPSFIAMAAFGAALAILPHVFANRRGRPASLTVWILSLMGVGIVVGAAFRTFSPLTFEPRPARLEGGQDGPFDLSSPLGFVVRSGDGREVEIRLGGPDQPAAAPATQVAGLINRQTELVRAGRTDHRLFLATEQRGAGVRLSAEDVIPGSLERLGLPPGPVMGAGSRTSFVRDFHDFLKALFINALKMMIVPIIFTSIISGMLSLGQGGIGRLGLKTLVYYLATSLLAILTGLVLVNLISPGEGALITLEARPKGFVDTAAQSPSEFLFGFFISLIPTNPIAAMVQGEILQIIFFALLMGYFINRLPDRLRLPLTNLFQGLFEVMLLIVRLMLWLAPLGVYAIFVKIIGETGPEAFVDLGWYALAVFLGLVIHAAVTLPLLLRLVGRAPPWRHFKAMSPALLTAFSTSSSSATLPVTLRCIEERAGVSNRTSSFVLPLGATVNMDGTALYECVAAIFIAQIYVSQGQIPPLTVGQQFLVVFTALAASIGAAGVPMAGMVMLGIILKALNLPLEGVGYVLAVDRILDMCRTTVNVWSDSVGCATIASTEGEKILEDWPPPSVA